MFDIAKMKRQPIGSYQPRFESWLRNIAKDTDKNWDFMKFISDALVEYSKIDGKVTKTGVVKSHDDFTDFIHQIARKTK